MEVEITSRNLIKPSTPTPEHLRTLQLSCFDQMAPQSYMSCVFFYPKSDSKAETPTTTEKISHLQASLSEALTWAFPFAGKLIEEDNCVHCNEECVEFREAQVNWALDRLINDESKANLMNQLYPFPNELDFTPTILAVQVNVFSCGGVAIALSLSHKVADGFTFFSFVKGWSTSRKCLSFDAATYLPVKSNETHLRVPMPDNNQDKFITKRFVLSAEALADLRAKTSTHASRVQVATSLIWRAKILVAKGKRGGLLRDSLLIMPLNFRGKTGVPIPEDAAGNLCTRVVVKFQAAMGREPELSELVNLVGEGIRKKQKECTKIEDCEELFSSVSDETRGIHRELRRGEADVCLFTSHCRFPCYEADFGWGRPVLVASGNKPLDMVMMADTCCGTGLEAWVTLEPKDMLLFQQHVHVSAFTQFS